jgi:hypothetical protein
MILPCNYYQKDCDNDENVIITINKKLHDHFKTRKPNHQNMVPTLLSKEDLFIAEPETISSSGYDPIKKWLDPHYYIEDDPAKFIVNDQVEYYTIKESKPYLEKLGKCVNKTEEFIKFDKPANDALGNHGADIVIEVSIRDIVEHKQMIITESGIKLFAYMNNLGKLNQTAISYIRKQRKRLNHTQRAVAEKYLAKKGTELLRSKLDKYHEEIQGLSEFIHVDNTSTNSNSKDINEGNTTGESSASSSSLESNLEDFPSGTLYSVKSLTESNSLPANKTNKPEPKPKILESASLP